MWIFAPVAMCSSNVRRTMSSTRTLISRSEYRGDWERFGFFKLESIVNETVIRAYSMANYPQEKGVVKFNIRIATPPPAARDSLWADVFLDLQPQAWR